MSFLRFATALVLSLWIGGLAALALAGPQVFEILESQDGTNGRALAGVVFGTLVERFQTIGWILGGVLLLLLGLRAFFGPRPRRFAIRIWTVAAMLAMSVAASRFVTPRVAALRDDANGRISALPDTDPRRIEFARLHALSNGLMLVTLLAGVALIYGEAHDGV